MVETAYPFAGKQSQAPVVLQNFKQIPSDFSNNDSVGQTLVIKIIIYSTKKKQKFVMIDILGLLIEKHRFLPPNF